MQPLIHIGYHKTASTWLQKRVFSDEEMGFHFTANAWDLTPLFVNINTFRFDSVGVREKFEAGIEDARSRGLVPVLSNERFSGAPHRGGYDSRPVADRLAETFPDARVFVVIREQSSMLLSLYKQYVMRGGSASFPQYVGGHPHLFRFDYLEYEHLVRYYVDLFGEQNVLVLPYELLKMDARDFLTRLRRFSGAKSGVEPSNERMNAAIPSLALALKRRLNQFCVEDVTNVAPPFAFENSLMVTRRLSRRVSEILPDTLLTKHELRWKEFADSQAKGRYVESNRTVAEITNLDLASYGYEV